MDKQQIKNKLRQPSTYAGLALLFAFGDRAVNPELLASAADIVITAVTGLGGLLSTFLDEFKGE